MSHSHPPRTSRALVLAAAALTAPFVGAEAALAAPFWYIDPVTPLGEIVNDTYQLMMWLSIVILIIVEVGLLAAMIKFGKRKNDDRQPETWSHNTTLEIVWTVIPFIMLIIICVPTFKGLAYMANIPKDPELTIEVVGRQFFWEYRYPELNATFTTAMRTEANAKFAKGSEDWNKIALYMPVGRKMLMKLTGADVIHSWWVPAFGFQQMTTPGNLVQIPVEVTKPGDYEGACAYLCGPYHGQMDIKVKVVDQPTFDAWVAAHKAPGPIEPIAKVGKIGMVAPAPQKPAHGASGDAHGTAPAGGEHAAAASPAASGEPATAPAAPAADPKALAAKGQELYGARCAGCHGAAGAGTPPMFPPLAGAEQVNGDDAAFIDILLKGKTGEITVKGQKYNGMMPPFGTMTDEEVAAIATYVRASWGNNGKPILPEQVKAGR